MISLDEAVAACLESHGARFEVFIDPDAALLIRRGEFDGDLEEVIVAEDMLEDAFRGDCSAESDFEKVLGTTDPLQIIPEAVRKGEIQIAVEQRREMQEQKRKLLISRIARNAVNPQTNDSPRPPGRVERALEEVGLKTDPMESVESQVDDILDALRLVLPVKFAEVTVAVQLPAERADSGQVQIRSYGGLEREEWQNDGSWVGAVTLPAGMQNDFYDKVNNITSGTAEMRIAKDEDEF